MIKKILVSTDGSIGGGNAVRMAAELARDTGAELTVLHVLMHGEPPEALRHMAEVEHLARHQPKHETVGEALSMVGLPANIDDPGFDHEVIHSIGKRIAEAAAAQAHDLGAASVASEIVKGDIADAILDTAKHLDADLVVVGSRGLGRFYGLLMGSVSQKVSQLSECPCLIVK